MSRLGFVARPFAAVVLFCALIGAAFPPGTALADDGYYIGDCLGISRADLVSTLQAHENDGYYQGTAYSSNSAYLDCNVWPNGNPRSDGYTGMNCAGWVVRAVWDAGGDTSGVAAAEPSTQAESGASAWFAYAQQAGFQYYCFDDGREMLDSGVLTKGDIICMMPQSWPYLECDTHLFIYWGNGAGDDCVWQTSNINEISPMYIPEPACNWYVFPISERLGIDLQLTSAYPALTNGNPAYSLQGATYNVYADAFCTSRVASLTTDASGYASCFGLADGVYYVKAASAPPGYALDATVYPVQVRAAFVARVNTTSIALLTGQEQAGETVAADAPVGCGESTTVERLSGETRYETNAAIDAAGWTSCETVIVTTGENYPDALAASGLAGLADAAIVQTGGSALSAEARGTITALNAKRAIVAGGSSAVSEAVVNELAGMGLAVQRFAGVTRSLTALQLYYAGAALGAGSWGGTAVVAGGVSFADAMSSSPFAYAMGAPIFLAENDGSVSDAVLAAIRAGGFSRVIVIGGENAVSAAAMSRLAGAGCELQRIAGADRYETSAAFADFACEEGLSAENMGLATGANFPDALSGGALCGLRGSIMLLAGDGHMDVARQYVAKSARNAISVFGGVGAVPDAWTDAVRCTAKVNGDPVVGMSEASPASEEAPSPSASSDLEATASETGASEAALQVDAAVQETKTSGLTGRTVYTEDELRERWRAMTADPATDALFAVPSDASSYTAGTLSADALSFVSEYLNFVRAVAGLGEVSLDDALNANAAQGALVSACQPADAALSSSPSVPAGVTAEQAAAGLYACANSNLGYASGYATALEPVLSALLSDRLDGVRQNAGHRRWLLDPLTQTVGIGAASAAAGAAGGEGGTFVDVRVKGASEEYGTVTQAESASYEFVSWPASGIMPVELFGTGTPWSVTLNGDLYEVPDANEVRVTVTRTADGAAWTMDAADAQGAAVTDEYFAVNADSYGDAALCIIFNPGTKNLGSDDLSGTFEVTVSGLRLKAESGDAGDAQAGDSATVSFETTFAAMEGDAFARLSGADRYDTMLQVVQAEAGELQGKPVILATGENYPDALAANALAGLTGGAVVLTRSDELSAQARSALETLAPTCIYLVGGTASLSASVEDAANSYAPVSRISGTDRASTANAIYAAGCSVAGTAAGAPESAAGDSAGSSAAGWGKTCIVASSAGFADALSVSPLAYAARYPVFLTNAAGTLDAETLSLIQAGGFEAVLVVGGAAAVSDAVEGQLAGVTGAAVTRLAGGDRYATNAAIVSHELNAEGMELTSVAVATARNFPDALAGGALCGSGHSVMLLIDGSTSSVSPYNELLQSRGCEVRDGYILGGANCVSIGAERALNRATF